MNQQRKIATLGEEALLLRLTSEDVLLSSVAQWMETAPGYEREVVRRFLKDVVVKSNAGTRPATTHNKC